MAGERAAKLLEINIAEAIRRAVAEGYKGIGNQLEAFVKGMDIGAKGDMQKAHVAVAEVMRQAVSDAYEANVESVRKVPSYQRSNRNAGHLGRVIRRRDLVRASSDGIAFINESALRTEASHWLRLNFGAGEAAGPQPGPTPIRLFGEAVLNAQLPFGAQQAFILPKGFFIQGGQAVFPTASHRGFGSSAPFYPSRRSPYRPAVTAGIRGRHFMEAGLEAMARQLPIEYTDLINEWIQRGGRKARAVTNTVTA